MGTTWMRVRRLLHAYNRHERTACFPEAKTNMLWLCLLQMLRYTDRGARANRKQPGEFPSSAVLDSPHPLVL